MLNAETRRATFTSTIVVDFEVTPEDGDEGELARDALNDYLDTHDVSESFELKEIQ